MLAADVEPELSTFMKTVAVSANGVAFIVDRDGHAGGVIDAGAAVPQRRWRAEAGRGPRQPVRAGAGGSAVVAGVRPTRVGTSPNIDLITSTGESVDVASRHVGSIDGIDWDIVVAIPRSDFTAPIVKNAVGMFFVIPPRWLPR